MNTMQGLGSHNQEDIAVAVRGDRRRVLCGCSRVLLVAFGNDDRVERCLKWTTSEVQSRSRLVSVRLPLACPGGPSQARKTTKLRAKDTVDVPHFG